MCSSREGSVRLMRPERYAWLSVVAALLTIVLKTLAWWLTGSVGLLSDALESFVNLAGAVFALTMRSEEHTSELQSQSNLVCRLLLEKKKKTSTSTSLQTKTSNYATGG